MSAQLDQGPDRLNFASCDIIAECAGMIHGLSNAPRILREAQRPVVVVCLENFLDKIAQPGGLSASP